MGGKQYHANGSVQPADRGDQQASFRHRFDHKSRDRESLERLLSVVADLVAGQGRRSHDLASVILTGWQSCRHRDWSGSGSDAGGCAESRVLRVADGDTHRVGHRPGDVHEVRR